MASNGSNDEEGASRNTCKYCNKRAVNKIVKCVKCYSVMHRYCCEGRGIEVNLDNTTNCCPLSEPSEKPERSTSEHGNLTSTQVSDKGHYPLADVTVDKLRLEISYLEKLLAEKQQIIEDKTAMIEDKEYIIQIQKDQIKLLHANQVGRMEGFPPICSNSFETSVGGEISSGVCGQNLNKQRKQTDVASASMVSDSRTGGKSERSRDFAGQPRNRHDEPRSSGKRAPRNGDTDRGDIITGTAETSNLAAEMSFAGAARRAWLYVGRVNPQVREEAIVGYLQGKFAGNTFSVERLPRRDSANSVAFKVSADLNILDDLKRPEMWPRGVLVKRFRFFRGREKGLGHTAERDGQDDKVQQ